MSLRLTIAGTTDTPIAAKRERTTDPLAPAVLPAASGARLTLVLPWPPTGNHATQHTRAGRHYLTSEYKAYRLEVLARVLEARTRPLHGRLAISLHAWPPDARKRDLDNVWKTTADAMQHAGVYADDSQIDDMRVLRMPVDREHPRVNVFIQELS